MTREFRAAAYLGILSALMELSPASALGQERGSIWTERAPLPATNSEIAVAELDGRIYVIGGYPATRVYVDTVEDDAKRVAQRYKVQFTATQEYIDLLEHARDLLSHAVPDRSLEEVHLRTLGRHRREDICCRRSPTPRPRVRSLRPGGGRLDAAA